jgi:hypothetical protein
VFGQIHTVFSGNPLRQVGGLIVGKRKQSRGFCRNAFEPPLRYNFGEKTLSERTATNVTRADKQDVFYLSGHIDKFFRLLHLETRNRKRAEPI